MSPSQVRSYVHTKLGSVPDPVIYHIFQSVNIFSCLLPTIIPLTQHSVTRWLRLAF